MQTFSSFKLSESLLDAVNRFGYKTPTEIQAKTIPALLELKDVIGQSKTGSGKTAAFVLPILNLVTNTDHMALVLVPTRELAQQVEEFARKMVSKNSKVRIASIIGGLSMRPQHAALTQKPNIIIATPGRLLDHVARGTLRFDRLKMIVLDEADRMLDMGFYPQIKKVLMKLPRERQTAMFSATFSPEIRKLAREIMKKNPVEVQVGGEGSAPVTIDQQVREVPQGNKNDILMDELNARNGSVLIFTKTKHKSDKLTKFLLSYGYKVNRIHGNRTQAQRKKTIDDFKAGSINILVATDIAARGLDIAQVGHVINYDLPQNPEDYLHRIGRTGRAGSSGQALSFVTPEDRGKWKFIARFSNAKFSNTLASQQVTH